MRSNSEDNNDSTYKIKITSSYKLLLVGDERVGKTALRRRLCEDKFLENQKYNSTNNVDFDKFSPQDGFSLQIWDVGGDQRFFPTQNNLKIVSKDTNIICLMWDSTREHTLNTILNWLNQLASFFPPEERPPLILIAGKIDLDRETPLAEQEANAKKIAQECGFSNVSCVRVSARANKGIAALKNMLVKKLQEKTLLAEKMPADSSQRNPNENSNNSPAHLPTQPAYTATQYKHTREVRYKKLSEIISNPQHSGAQGLWLLMNLVSINDRKSQTSLLIEKPILARGLRVSGNNPSVAMAEFNRCLDNIKKSDYSEFFGPDSGVSIKREDVRVLNAVLDLLCLASKKETQFFGFKWMPFVWEENRNIRRVNQHREIALIYDLAHAIFNSVFSQIDATYGELQEKVFSQHSIALPTEAKAILETLLGKAPIPAAPMFPVNR